MSSRPPGMTPLSLSGASDRPPRHETSIPPAPPEAQAALGQALTAADRRIALRAVLEHWPALLEGWAQLSHSTWEGGDPVAAYAFARTGYHRGLDALRKHGWGGSGLVRWSTEGNRGFLRSLYMLLTCAATIGELDEAERCRAFLLDLDPDDGIGAGSVPPDPGPDWQPDRLP